MHKMSVAEITDKKEIERIATKVSLVSIVGNVLLSLCKLIAGIVAHSGAMVSDAVHSASDVISSIVVIIGIRLASKEADKEHPYGHERLECVAAIILSVLLFVTGAGTNIFEECGRVGCTGSFGTGGGGNFHCGKRNHVLVYQVPCEANRLWCTDG